MMVCLYVHMCNWVCEYVFLCMCVCTYICVYVCMHECMYASTQVHIYMCTYIRRYVYTYIKTYSAKLWKGEICCFWCFSARPSKFYLSNCLKTIQHVQVYGERQWPSVKYFLSNIWRVSICQKFPGQNFALYGMCNCMYSIYIHTYKHTYIHTGALLTITDDNIIPLHKT